jgi:Ser/Thr protein kinase RdoA (MazF antagonist)
VTPFDALGTRGQLARLRGLAAMALEGFDVEIARRQPLPVLAHRENTTFGVRAADGSRLVLRIHRVTGGPGHPVRTIDEVHSEMAWLAALRRDTDLRVPLPIAARDGGHLVVQGADGIPGDRICVLLGWLDGRFVDRRLTPDHLERVGRYIGGLHEHAAGWARPADYVRHDIGELSEPTVEGMLRLAAELGRPEDVATTDAVIRLALASQLALDAEPVSRLLIHGDLHQENYLFDGSRIGAIDFDDSGFGYLAYDLSVPLFELSDRPGFAALRDGLFRGYRTIRAFPIAHERHVEVFQAFRVLQVTLWLIERRHEPAFADWERWVRLDFEALRSTLRTLGRPRPSGFVQAGR